MTPEEQNWTISDVVAGSLDPRTMSPCDGKEHLFIHRPNGDYECLDYTSDLNAMHEAEKVLLSSEGSGWRKVKIDDQKEKTAFVVYKNTLRKIALKDKTSVYPTHYDDLKCLRATASQRAEAFLKTLNLWKDDQ